MLDKLKVMPEDNDTSKSLADAASVKRIERSTLSGAAFDKPYAENEVMTYHQTVNSAEFSRSLGQFRRFDCGPANDRSWRLAPVRCEAAIRPKAGPKQKCLSHTRIDVNDPKRISQ